MADAEPEPMQAGVVNVLLTIDPAASHAAGTYLTWDGAPFDEEETARCDAATPHELWAWTITTDEAPGAAAEPRADVRRLTTIVAGAPGQAPDAFNEAVLAHFAGCRARDVLGPGGGGPGTGGTGAAGETLRRRPGRPGATVLTRSSSARPCCRGSSATRCCPAWPGWPRTRPWRSWDGWSRRPPRRLRTLLAEAPSGPAPVQPPACTRPAAAGDPGSARRSAPSPRRPAPKRTAPGRSARAAARRLGRGDVRGHAPVLVQRQVPGGESPVPVGVHQGLGGALRFRGTGQGHLHHRGRAGDRDVMDLCRTSPRWPPGSPGAPPPRPAP